MSGTPLKICGLMRPEDVASCCALGVSVIGFVTEYPVPVPWNLSEAQCRSLLPSVKAPARSCIVTGGSVEKILGLARRLRPSLVQLHYKESLEDTRRIVQALSPLGIGVVKTIPAGASERLEQLGSEDPEACALLLCDAGVQSLLVDSRGPENAAGSGHSFDAALYRRIRHVSSVPVVLGGGITPDNCREIVRSLHPDMLDVMTGVELSPGVKAPDRIARMLENI